MEKTDISVSFLLMTGLGDCIINKKFILEFYNSMKTSSSVIVDLYVHKSAQVYVESIFSDCTFIHRIYFTSEKYFRENIFKYDISIKLHYFIELCYLNTERLEDADWNLAFKMLRLKDFLSKYKLNLSNPTDLYIHFSRCTYFGLNCYTAYNYGDIFHIHDNKVSIPLEGSYKTLFKKLNLSNAYITMNYGWGSNNQIIPPKAWPIKYYKNLVKIIKNDFPNLKIVQVGSLHSSRILGVDYYFLGESLELVKYILKNAILHIDCEGALTHIATQLETKCIVLFGPTPIHYFGYEQNDNLVSNICHGCLFLNGNLTECARYLTEPECMKWISPEMVMECVKENLKVIYK